MADAPDRAAPLAAVRVLNLGTRWPGRVAAMLLADQGADVVEIVRPGREAHAVDPAAGPREASGRDRPQGRGGGVRVPAGIARPRPTWCWRTCAREPPPPSVWTTATLDGGRGRSRPRLPPRLRRGRPDA